MTHRNLTAEDLYVESLVAESAAIAAAIEARKSRAMIYQVDEKERIALANGLPADAYYLLPYADWCDIRA